MSSIKVALPVAALAFASANVSGATGSAAAEQAIICATIFKPATEDGTEWISRMLVKHVYELGGDLDLIASVSQKFKERAAESEDVVLDALPGCKTLIEEVGKKEAAALSR